VRDLEGNGDRLLIDGLFQLNLVKSCDVNGVAHWKTEGSGVDRAGSIYTKVWVWCLIGDTACVEEVLEGMGGKASIAAVVVEITGTINELLLSVGFQYTVLDQVSWLEASNSGESPARAAISLVFDGGYTTLLNPVKGIGCIVDITSCKGWRTGGRAVLFSVGLVLVQMEVIGELRASHSGEFIDSTSKRLLRVAVVLNDRFNVA